MRKCVLFAMAMLTTAFWGDSVHAQSDGFVTEFVDPTLASAETEYMMADSTYSLAKPGHDSQVQKLVALRAELEDCKEALTSAEYQAVLDLLDAADADLIINGALLGFQSSALDDAVSAGKAAEDAYDDEAYEEAYGLALVTRADTGLDGHVTDCATTADSNMVAAKELLDSYFP